MVFCGLVSHKGSSTAMSRLAVPTYVKQARSLPGTPLVCVPLHRPASTLEL